MNKRIVVNVCMGTGGIAAGGAAVLDAFGVELGRADLRATLEEHCATHQVGCRGFCARDVLVDVSVNGQRTTYEFIKPDMVARIVDEHIVGGRPVEEWMVGEDYHAFHSRQNKVVLSRCGLIDPESIEQYIASDGYVALDRVLNTMSPEGVIDTVLHSGLRGRGGAGFPTGMKWRFARQAPGLPKYIICNADEGDPGAFMDRSVLEGDPHGVLEGLIIGGYAIGSETGYVYIRAEYRLAVSRLERAIAEARDRGFLGKNICGSTFSFDIRLKKGAGAFVCGEETALIASIEGKRGMPRPRPPFPAGSGLWGKPTNINNVETLANVPSIVLKGADWFLGFGTENSRGTKVFCITGKVKRSGLIEVPMGITLREIIFEIGGGILKDRAFKAVQTGGPSGGVLPESLLDLPVDYQELAKAGSIMGSGGVVILDETTCMVDVARYFLTFTQSESCGKCTPCREGLQRLYAILDRICKGQGVESDLERLETLGRLIKDSSLCGLGQTAPNPILTVLRYFREEVEAHIVDRRCPAGVCPDLVTFTIDPERCTACGKCRRKCPVGAIEGAPKVKHVIVQEKCIKCGSCFEACPDKFAAVIRT